MFKNYIKIAWRNLIKDKVNTILNVIGLSVAFAAAILLGMAAYFQLSFDHFHDKGTSIYKTIRTQQSPKGPDAGTAQPAPFAPALKSEVPGVKRIARYLQDGALAQFGEKEIKMAVIWVDPDFFAMFNFPIINGNGYQPLNDLSSVVLTKEAAHTLFGSDDVIGKSFNLLINGQEKPFTVSAVTENVPAQSSLEYEMAIRFENHWNYLNNKDVWDSRYHDVYIELENGVTQSQFEDGSRPFMDLHYKGEIEKLKRDGASANADGRFIDLKLVPLTDVHFTSLKNGTIEVSRSLPYLILAVAFLILFIACVNYINMSIAKSAKRLREIGMRKTLGAKKQQLFFQFWSESLFIFIASMGIGIILSVMLLGEFKTMFNTEVSAEMLLEPTVIIGLLGGILGITMLVGGYPALLMSRLDTIRSLKGKLDASGSDRVRDVLMVFQFGIAILLIIGTLVLWSQITYMRDKDLGFDKEQVISFPLNGKQGGYEVVERMRDALRGNPDILSVGGADNNLGIGKDGSTSSSKIGFEYKGRVVITNFLVTDHEYIPTVGLQLVMGRNFESAADSLGVIINESMAKELGDQDPLSIQLEINDGIHYPVIGVVKDYNFNKLDRAIEPITFYQSKDLGLSYGYIKVAPDRISGAFETIERTWKELEPNASFLGSFLNENIDRTFRREKATVKMIASGSVIAIILSCMGLFAMSILIVSQRTKEIGIRKVVGASVASIIYILTKDFLKLVLLAFVISSPIAWWMMKEWLENYAYRIELNIWYFVGAGGIAVGIALLTISTRAIGAATANPVKSLRNE